LAATQLQDVPLVNQLARQAAMRNIGPMELRAIRPSVYLAAAKRASAQATKALSRGDFLKALGEKEAELVAHAMYRAARNIQKEADKMQRYLLRMSEDTALARLGKAGPHVPGSGAVYPRKVPAQNHAACSDRRTRELEEVD
jgi:2-oxoglutarate dehydrogenase complex dehydrogenase (E1) component-like enzyme